ncbi:MAG TPA: DUF4388 domain-containing protein [Chloroflexaceae bacterium]|nr:DUF4388 domain-containing protein [Chloroflexaceae bacterium]
MKLEGSLKTIPLGELVEIAIYSSVTGALNIYPCHGDQGRLYFREGTLYHAERGRATGVDALAELIELGGTFAFVSDMVSEQESLWGSLAHHMQTAERLATRWRQVRPYVPTLDLTPALLVPRETALRRIGPAHQPVLAALDGHASLRLIAEHVGWATIDVAEAIVQMSVDGLLDLRNERPAPQPDDLDQALRPAGGLFDRLRAMGQPAPCAAEAEPARSADSRASEELILKLLRS